MFLIDMLIIVGIVMRVVSMNTNIFHGIIMFSRNQLNGSPGILTRIICWCHHGDYAYH